jgi:hypothetical protein
MFWHFREPVMITEGKMQYLFDERGRRYLDVSADCTTWTSQINMNWLYAWLMRLDIRPCSVLQLCTSRSSTSWQARHAVAGAPATTCKYAAQLAAQLELP